MTSRAVRSSLGNDDADDSDVSYFSLSLIRELLLGPCVRGDDGDGEDDDGEDGGKDPDDHDGMTGGLGEISCVVLMRPLPSPGIV